MSGSEASVGSMHNSGKRRVQTPAIEPASQAAKVPLDAKAEVRN
jgi:ribosomal protein S30